MTNKQLMLSGLLGNVTASLFILAYAFHQTSGVIQPLLVIAVALGPGLSAWEFYDEFKGAAGNES